MRTRIALVAIIPIALITVGTLTLAATEQPARADTPTSSGASTASLVVPATKSVAHQSLTSVEPTTGSTGIVLDLNTKLLAVPAPVVTPPPAPTPPAPVGPVDTVTPDQRAAWTRVAICEEGGNWSYDSGRFSGGLGITRTNWAAYGGEEFAPEGAEATPDEQIMVAERIQSTPPDQYGCAGW
jgi:hypothetical protein